MLLRGRQRIVVAGLHELEPAAEPRRIRGAQQEGVELLRRANRIADAAGAAAAVAEEHRDRLRRMPGDHEHRHAHGVAAIFQLDDVAFTQAALLGEPRADPRRRVPGDLGIRLRQFLQPAVVGEAAVPDGRIGPEDDFEAARRGRSGRGRSGRRRRRWSLLNCGRGGGRRRGVRCRGGRCGSARGHQCRARRALREARARDETIVQRRAPEGIGIREALATRILERPAASAAAVRLGPEILDDRQAAAPGLRRKGGQEIVRRPSFVERIDQRLRQRDGPLERSRISPAFERVCLGDVPVAERRRLVRMRRVVDDERNLGEPIGKTEIDGRREHGVTAHDHEQLDLSGVDGLAELHDRTAARCGYRFGTAAVQHRRAGVAERVIDGFGGGADAVGLEVAGDDHRAALVGLKILGDRGHPPGDIGRARAATRRRRRRRRAGNRRRQLARDAFDLGGRDRQPMIGLGAGERRGALDGVQAVHRGVLLGEPAPCRKVLRVPDVAGSARQKVGVQRDDHVRLVELVDRGGCRRDAGRPDDRIGTDAISRRGSPAALLPAARPGRET